MSVRTRRPPALTFGTYQLVERLHGPSLAERHRALGADGRFVVLHVVRPELARDFAFRGLFQVQAAKARTLAHPNVARIVDAGEVAGRWYIAVEETAGEDLAARLAALRSRGDRLPRPEAVSIVRDVAAALGHAHERGVVHGDVRPGNVMLGASGAVLTGFVIARSLRTDAQDRIAVGAFAPAYMSPEQSEGKPPDQRSDIYALGVLAYELLTGRTPYAGETPLAVLLAHGREPLPLPSHVDPAVGAPVERVLLRALAVDPSARHPDPSSFVASLDDALGEDARHPPAAVTAAPPDTRVAARALPPPAGRLLGGPYALAAGAAAALAVGIGLGLVFARPAPVATAPAVAASPAAATAAPPAPTPAPPPRPTPTAVPPPSPLARGALLYEAKLDGSAELRDVHVFSGGAADASIRSVRGAIELEVAAPRGGAEAFFPIAARSSFVGDFSVIVPSGSQALLTWALRRDGEASYLIRLDAAAETLALVYDDGARLREALAPQVRVPGLRGGRAVAISFSASGPDLVVHLDGRAVIQARDVRIGRSTRPPDVFVGDEGGVGVFRLVAARLYAAP